MKYALLTILLASCSFVDGPVKRRVPASFINQLPESAVFKNSFNLYAGHGLNNETPVARSLTNTSMSVEVHAVSFDSSRLLCKRSDQQNFTRQTEFKLQSNNRGFFQSVICKLDKFSGGDTPERQSISVKYTVENSTKDMRIEVYEDYLLLSQILKDHQSETPSLNLYNYIEKHSHEKEKLTLSNENFFTAETLFNRTTVEITQIIGEKYLKRGNRGVLSPAGDIVSEKKKSRLLDPRYNSNEVICELGNKKIGASRLEKIVLYNFSGKLKCYVNIPKKLVGKKNSKIKGEFKILVREVSSSSLEETLQRSVSDEAFSFKNRVSGQWKTDLADYSTLEKALNSNNEKDDLIFNEVKRSLFRDKIIDGIFQETITGDIGKGFTEFSFVPKEKKFFSADGTMKSATYLELTNKTYATFKAPSVDTSIEYTPFAEDLKIFLNTSDPFNEEISSFTLNVCEGRKQDFFFTLAELQQKTLQANVSISEYMRELRKHSLSSELSKCPISSLGKYTAKRLDKYSLIGPKRNRTTLEVKRFGAYYQIPLENINWQALIEKSGPQHPLLNKEIQFKVGFKITPENEVYFQVNKDEFISGH